MVLNRNPDNFFAETEQVAFCAAHIVPGLDFSNDPLLAGRIHSYHGHADLAARRPQLPRDPHQRAGRAGRTTTSATACIARRSTAGRVSYEPNSLAGGCPFQAGAAGFTSFREPIEADKVRGKPERFAEHYTQATLFWNSQTPVEKAHIIRGFRFELTKVQVPAVRERVVAMLANVDAGLAKTLAASSAWQLPAPLPKALKRTPQPEVDGLAGAVAVRAAG